MSVLKPNHTLVNGKYKRFNYYLMVSLPTGKVRITLPNTKDDKRLANRLQHKANAL